MSECITTDIKAIIGLGNPGAAYEHTRHSVGFMVLDALANQYGIGSWREHETYASCDAQLDNKKVLLIKPLTYMNNSGRVVPMLAKKGIKAENILVVHDELELPFGQVKTKIGGSARGHNGLRSLIEHMGEQFMRVRIGIGRPTNKEDVASYVLSSFAESPDQIEQLIDQAVNTIIKII